MKLNRIFVDFNNADEEGRIRLIVAGAIGDFKAQGIILVEGLELILDDHQEFRVKGIVEFSKSENIWVGRIDWNALEPSEIAHQ